MKRIYLYIAALSVALAGCNKFLDVPPKGKVIPGTVEDYHLLLASIDRLPIEAELFLTADDFMSENSNLGSFSDPYNDILHLYTYSSQRFSDPNGAIESWNTPYRFIYIFNKVIKEIDNARDALGFNEQDRKRIKAEALYGRAAQYLFLVNMFAKHYNKTTAASDVAIPILLEANLSQILPPKSTVAQVYDLIVKDLTAAIPDLPVMRIDQSRPSKGTGYAMLARTYLFQGEYELALKNAESALSENAKLSDYIAAKDMLVSYGAEQYSQMFFGTARGYVYGILSEEIIKLYDSENDMRLTKLFSCAWIENSDEDYEQDCSKRQSNYQFYPNPLPSVSEMYIVAAECYARANKSDEALKKLNALRKARIKDVVDKTAADFATPDDLLKFTLEERRREMVVSGIRLFDLKRLNLDPRFAKTVKHTVDGKVYEAAPNSGKLVLPIPMQVQKFN